jgi:hypothetical protein
MSTIDPTFASRWSQGCLRAGGLALLVSAGLIWLAPAAAAPAYRFALFACLQPALGCLLFSLIYRITGGQWGESLEPLLAAGTRMLPWVWPLVVPLLFWPGARPALAASGPLPRLTGPWALLVRVVIYELIFLAAGRVARQAALRRYAPPALIVLVFALHVLAADWFFTLDPGWYSTGFPLVWMAVQATAGLALVLALAPACGRSPAAVGSAGRPVGIDWGNLLLTTVIFSSYLAYIQFLVIWSGNLPREIIWFERRLGGWRYFVGGLALLHLFLPMGFLLSRPWKESPRGVPRLAVFLCGVEVAWAAWFILPPFADRGGCLLPLSAALLVLGAALFCHRFLARLARREGTP